MSASIGSARFLVIVEDVGAIHVVSKLRSPLGDLCFSHRFLPGFGNISTVICGTARVTRFLTCSV